MEFSHYFIFKSKIAIIKNRNHYEINYLHITLNFMGNVFKLLESKYLNIDGF